MEQQPFKWDIQKQLCKVVFCNENTTAKTEAESLKFRKYNQCLLLIVTCILQSSGLGCYFLILFRLVIKFSLQKCFHVNQLRKYYLTNFDLIYISDKLLSLSTCDSQKKDQDNYVSLNDLVLVFINTNALDKNHTRIQTFIRLRNFHRIKSNFKTIHQLIFMILSIKINPHGLIQSKLNLLIQIMISVSYQLLATLCNVRIIVLIHLQFSQNLYYKDGDLVLQIQLVEIEKYEHQISLNLDKVVMIGIMIVIIIINLINVTNCYVNALNMLIFNLTQLLLRIINAYQQIPQIADQITKNVKVALLWIAVILKTKLIIIKQKLLMDLIVNFKCLCATANFVINIQYNLILRLIRVMNSKYQQNWYTNNITLCSNKKTLVKALLKSISNYCSLQYS